MENTIIIKDNLISDLSEDELECLYSFLESTDSKTVLLSDKPISELNSLFQNDTRFYEKFMYVFHKDGVVTRECEIDEYLESKSDLVTETSYSEDIEKYELAYQEILDIILRYLAGVRVPLKTSGFVIKGDNCIKIYPSGNNLDEYEKEEFIEYDEKWKVLEELKSDLEDELEDWGVLVTVGSVGIYLMPKNLSKENIWKDLQESESFKFYSTEEETFNGIQSEKIESINPVISFLSETSEIIDIDDNIDDKEENTDEISVNDNINQ